MALGGVFAAVSLFFLTVAAWIAAVDAFGALAAALIIAGGYMSVALILFLVARRSRPRRRDRRYLKSPPPPLAEAFFAGLRAGRKMRRR